MKYRLALAAILLSSLISTGRATDSSSVLNVGSNYNAVDIVPGLTAGAGFTVSGGQVYTWSGYPSTYQVGNISTGTVTNYGAPSNVASNGYGDPFGVYDSVTDTFYAGTYDNTEAHVYSYKNGAWSDLGNFPSLYAAKATQGRLYVSGLNQIWNGTTGQDNQIALFDLSGGNKHDVIIQATGNSAGVAVDIYGNVYYANYNGDTSPALYRWSSELVDSVRADLGNGTAGGDETDLYLTYAQGELLTYLAAGANGISVDEGGNVFITINGSVSELVMWNELMGTGEGIHTETIATAENGWGWLGAIDTEGDFNNGGAVYTSDYGTNVVKITSAVPEPSTFVLLVGAVSLGGLLRMRRVNGQKMACLLLIVGTSVWSLHAGPYSPGKGGSAESAFVDAGIAGFVGPAGEGVTATATNGNYVNPVFKSWATGYANYVPSDIIGTYGMNGIGTQFANPVLATGAVTGDNFDIVSLGDMSAAELLAYWADPDNATVKPGVITLTFERAITNGPGADFAVFENGFVSNYNTSEGSVSGQMFAELAYVEVSTDGVNFARFPSAYLNATPTGSMAYLTQDVSNIYNLAGKHANAYGISWGTPFNLDDLANDSLVTDGIVDLSEIHYVRIVDIPGNGSFLDALGHSIYDAWVTWGSGGLDLEAVGVINEVEESRARTQSILRLKSKTPAFSPAKTVPDGVQKTPDGRLFL